MAINREKYLGKYVDEGLENLTLIETLLFNIKNGVSVRDDLATLLRSLHTLKGSSRMLGFNRIEELSHALENVFIVIRDQHISLSESALKRILTVLDVLKSGFGIIQGTGNDAINVEGYIADLGALAASDEFTRPKETDNGQETGQDSSGNVTAAEKSHKEARSESMRLPLEKIDNIIKSITSLHSIEIAARGISLEGLALNDLGKEFSGILKDRNQIDHAVLMSNFRKLEHLSRRLNSLLRNFSLEVGSQIRNAYDSVISLRTIPLSTIFDSYPRYVFQLSGELGKRVNLTIEGKENEIDKNIIESISEVFLHMVRNSIDHGIETPEERIAAGKSESGNLSIICTRESGNIKVVFSDDGRGIDIEKIRQKAVRIGFLPADTAASVSKEDLTNLIFRSGFSTSGKISNISGRGVGMDVVRDSVEVLKGSIVVDSVFGEGTTFTIMIPLSIAALMGFPIICGSMKFIIPSNFVDTVLMINREDIISVVDCPEIKYHDRLIKLYYLSRILRIPAGPSHSDSSVFVIVVRSYDHIAALAVDDISGMRSVVLKTLPAFMNSKSVFSGLVQNEEYEMIAVLHIPTVIRMAKQLGNADSGGHDAEFKRIRKTILVVDDSLPTREIESEILSSEGYLVNTAADGEEALQAIKNMHYDLICTDINMPVMDGFMLTENIKNNEHTSHIPVIVISSRESEEDQKRAAMLGASRYIVKNSFNNYNLLKAVEDLIGN